MRSGGLGPLRIVLLMCGVVICCAAPAHAQRWRSNDVPMPISFDELVSALRPSEPIDQATWDEIVATYEQHLDRMAQVRLVDELAFFETKLIGSGESVAEAHRRMRNDFAATRRFAQFDLDLARDVIAAFPEAKRAECERLLVWGQLRWLRSLPRVWSGRGQDGLPISPNLRALTLPAQDRAILAAALDELDAKQLALLQRRREAECDARLAFEEIRRNLPPRPRDATDEAQMAWWRTRMEMMRPPWIPVREIDRKIDRATDGAIDAVLPRLSQPARRGVLERYAQLRLSYVYMSVESHLAPVRRALVAPWVTAELRSRAMLELEQWRSDDEAILHDLVATGRERSVRELEQWKSGAMDESEWAQALEQRSNELTQRRWARVSTTAASVLTLLAKPQAKPQEKPQTDDSAAPKPDPATSSGEGSSDESSAPPMLEEDGDPFWIGLEGTLGQPAQEDPYQEEQGQEASNIEWIWSTVSVSDIAAFAGRFHFSSERTAALEALHQDLLQRWNEMVEPQVQRFVQMSERVIDQESGMQMPNAATKLGAIERAAINEANAAESDFFAGVVAIASADERDAAIAWQLRHRLGDPSRFMRVSDNLPSVEGTTVLRRHANFALATEKAALPDDQRMIAERILAEQAEALLLADADLLLAEHRSSIEIRNAEIRWQLMANGPEAEEAGLREVQRMMQATRESESRRIAAAARRRLELNDQLRAALKSVLSADAFESVDRNERRLTYPGIDALTRSVEHAVQALRNRVQSLPELDEAVMMRFEVTVESWRRRDEQIVDSLVELGPEAIVTRGGRQPWEYYHRAGWFAFRRDQESRVCMETLGRILPERERRRVPQALR